MTAIESCCRSLPAKPFSARLYPAANRRFRPIGVGLMSQLKISGLECPQVISNRKEIILLAFITVVAVAAIYDFRMIPVYQATGRVAINPRLQMNLTEGKTAAEGQIQPHQEEERLQTQLQILRGRELAKRVIEALKLDRDPDYVEMTLCEATARAATEGRPDNDLSGSNFISAESSRPRRHPILSVIVLVWLPCVPLYVKFFSLCQQRSPFSSWAARDLSGLKSHAKLPARLSRTRLSLAV